MTTTTPIEIQINASANGQQFVDGMANAVDAVGNSAGSAAPRLSGVSAESKGLSDIARGLGIDLTSAGGAFAKLTAEIAGNLALQRSENDLVRAHIDARQREQQAILDAANARGDESAAASASNALKQIEVERLQLSAAAKRQEAQAAELVLQARREEMALAGPLTQAQSRQLQIAENRVSVMRQEAASIDASISATQASIQAAEREARARRDAASAADLQAQAVREQTTALNSERESINSLLALQRSENDLVRERIKTRQIEQEAIRDAAKARGDEAAAIRATNTLKEIEAAKLQLAAQQKRQEIHAAEALLATKHKELALTGVINQNDQRALQASQNKIAAMRQEAASLDAAADAARANQKATSGAAGENAKLGASSLSAAGALTALGSVVASVFAQQFVQALIDTENLAMGLNAIAQNSQVAGEQLEFVRRMSTAAGVDVVETGKAFLALQASTKGTAVEGKATSDVFEAVTVSMAKAGKSSAETSLALQALGQMAGKGVVSMEELRGQLGEALPGAMQAAAKGMGITVADLTKLVESGKVAAEDIFPALTSGLKDLYGTAPDAQTLSAEIANMKNAFTEFAANLGDAGVGSVFKNTLEYLQLALVGLENTIIVTGKELGIFLAAVASMDFSNFANAIAEVEQQAQDKVGRLAEHNSVLQRAMGITADQARQMSKSLRDAGDATKKAGEEAAGAGTGYIGITNAYEKLYDELSRYIDVAKKEVELSKATGDAAVAKARLLGDEAEVRKAVAESAKAQATALVTLAERQQAEVDAIRAELEEKRRLLAAEGPISEQRQKQLKELEDLIVKKQVEAATTAQQAAKAQDHAKAVSEKTLRLQDEVKKTEALTAVKRTEAQANIMSLETQLKLAQSSEDLARVMGNEEGVRKAKIAQMEIEIKITKAKAEVQEIEARGTIAVAQAKIEELKATNQLTPLKEAELNASIKLAEAKIAEAQAMGKSTEATEELLRRIKNGTVDFEKFGNAGAGAFGQIATGAATANAALQQQQDHLDLMMTKYKQSYQYSERQIELLEKQAAATEKLAEAERKRLNIDKEGFSTDKNGQRINVEQATVATVAQRLMAGGFDADRANREAQDIIDNITREAQMGTRISGMSMSTQSSRVGGRLENLINERLGAGAIGGTPTPTRTVNVNLNMGGKKVNANIPQSQERTFLDMLAADKGASL